MLSSKIVEMVCDSYSLHSYPKHMNEYQLYHDPHVEMFRIIESPTPGGNGFLTQTPLHLQVREILLFGMDSAFRRHDEEDRRLLTNCSL